VRASNDFGIAVRAGTPAPIQARITDAYRTAVRKPEIVQRLADMGLIVLGSTAAEFARDLAADTAPLRRSHSCGQHHARMSRIARAGIVSAQ
jgi:tripartite-type tricarboxylate transporter receptor subunit TctC